MNIIKTYLLAITVFMTFVGCSTGPVPQITLSNADDNEIMQNPIQLVVELVPGESKYDKKGRELVEKGDFLGSLDYFRQAIDQNPSDHAALFNASAVSYALGDHDRAKKFIKRAINIEKTDKYQQLFDYIAQSE